MSRSVSKMPRTRRRRRKKKRRRRSTPRSSRPAVEEVRLQGQQAEAATASFANSICGPVESSGRRGQTPAVGHHLEARRSASQTLKESGCRRRRCRSLRRPRSPRPASCRRPRRGGGLRVAMPPNTVPAAAYDGRRVFGASARTRSRARWRREVRRHGLTPVFARLVRTEGLLRLRGAARHSKPRAAQRAWWVTKAASCRISAPRRDRRAVRSSAAPPNTATKTDRVAPPALHMAAVETTPRIGVRSTSDREPLLLRWRAPTPSGEVRCCDVSAMLPLRPCLPMRFYVRECLALHRDRDRDQIQRRRRRLPPRIVGDSTSASSWTWSWPPERLRKIGICIRPQSMCIGVEALSTSFCASLRYKSCPGLVSYGTLASTFGVPFCCSNQASSAALSRLREADIQHLQAPAPNCSATQRISRCTRPWGKASSHTIQPQQSAEWRKHGDDAAPPHCRSRRRRLRRLVRRVGRDVRLARGEGVPPQVERISPEKQQTQHVEVPRRRRGRRHARGVRRRGLRPNVRARSTAETPSTAAASAGPRRARQARRLA